MHKASWYFAARLLPGPGGLWVSLSLSSLSLSHLSLSLSLSHLSLSISLSFSPLFLTSLSLHLSLTLGVVVQMKAHRAQGEEREQDAKDERAGAAFSSNTLTRKILSPYSVIVII
jgi:hypothetical protein